MAALKTFFCSFDVQRFQSSPRGGLQPKSNRARFAGVFMNSPDRSAVERPAGSVSVAQHLLAAVAAVGRTRGVGQSLTRVLSPTECPWPIGLVRSICQWPFRASQKRVWDRENRVRQGPEVDGGARWPGCSSGKSHRIDAFGGSNAVGTHFHFGNNRRPRLPDTPVRETN